MINNLLTNNKIKNKFKDILKYNIDIVVYDALPIRQLINEACFQITDCEITVKKKGKFIMISVYDIDTKTDITKIHLIDDSSTKSNFLLQRYLINYASFMFYNKEKFLKYVKNNIYNINTIYEYMGLALSIIFVEQNESFKKIYSEMTDVLLKHIDMDYDDYYKKIISIRDKCKKFILEYIEEEI